MQNMQGVNEFNRLMSGSGDITALGSWVSGRGRYWTSELMGSTSTARKGSRHLLLSLDERLWINQYLLGADGPSGPAVSIYTFYLSAMLPLVGSDAILETMTVWDISDRQSGGASSALVGPNIEASNNMCIYTVTLPPFIYIPPPAKRTKSIRCARPGSTFRAPARRRRPPPPRRPCPVPRPMRRLCAPPRPSGTG